MNQESVRLSSSEIAGLWEAYTNECMSKCLITYFLHHIKDEEIKQILERSLHISNTHLKELGDFYSKEEIPLPDGFTEADINLSAPPLFYDTFALSFIYSMCRMQMIHNSFLTANIARQDILAYFTKILNEASELYRDSTALMLSKGIYDRPPMIPYPKKVEYAQNPSFIGGFMGKNRPLSVIEITEIFFNIERNYFSVLLCMGLLQVVEDKQIKRYLQEGREISEKQIKLFNDLLMKEDLLAIVSVNMEVTDSTTSPFSDKFIVALFNFLNSIDITLIGHALSLSMRVDLAPQYGKYIAEIMAYSKKGVNILVERNWMEQPPLAPDRKELRK